MIKKHIGIAAATKKVAQQGRHGDSTLMHVQPRELAGMQAMMGRPLTKNPKTGLPEAFSWGSLLGLIGGAIAAPFTGGASLLPGILGAGGGALGGGLLGSGIGAVVSALTKKKESSSSQSDAGKYLDDKYKKSNKLIPLMSVLLDQPSSPPDQYGRERTYAMGKPISVAPAGSGFVDPSVYGGSTKSPYAMYAEGGQVAPEEAKAQQVMAEAMAAIRGQHPNPEAALNEFVKVFGREELEALIQSLTGAAAQDQQMARGGYLRGPGAGMDDMIPASLHGNRKVLLSGGEFVVPADVVSHLGDGSSDAGARKLDAMMDRVRREKTGRPKQPGKINDRRVMPA